LLSADRNIYEKVWKASPWQARENVFPRDLLSARAWDIDLKLPGTPFPYLSLSLTYSPTLPAVEDDEEKSNYWGTWFWGGGGGIGDERKTCLSVFLSVTVACNPAFIPRLLNCDPGTTGMIVILFGRNTVSAICKCN
jgi:hypothetical protein